MKKVLSILLCVCMLSACFVAMIPTANAAVSDPARFDHARKGELIYKEDFEGADVVSAGNDTNALFAALGWGGTVGGGIKLAKDAESENNRLKITGPTEKMIVCKDDMLKGGGYMVEYTAIMADVPGATGDGMGFRSSYDNGSNPTTAGWNFLTKERGNFDFHFHYPGVTAGNRHSEQDLSPEAVTVGGVSRPDGSIVGQEYRFRLVIDPIYGLSAYTLDLETGEATIVVGMNAANVPGWANYSHTLGDELIIRVIGSKTVMLIDDIEVYEADSNSYQIPGVVGYQTTDLTGSPDTYDIRFVSKIEKETEALSIGYKVEYRYKVADLGGDRNKDMMYTGSTMVTCHHVYTSISENGGQDEINFGAFNIVALHINDIPTARDVNGVPVGIDITFTVTPFATFWSDFGHTEVLQYGNPYTCTVNIPD